MFAGLSNWSWRGNGKVFRKLSFKGRCAVTPNDPKLSDSGVRRGTCMVGGKAAAEAGAVTHGAVRCSAWLGDLFTAELATDKVKGDGMGKLVRATGSGDAAEVVRPMKLIVRDITGLAGNPALSLPRDKLEQKLIVLQNRLLASGREQRSDTIRKPDSVGFVIGRN